MIRFYYGFLKKEKAPPLKECLKNVTSQSEFLNHKKTVCLYNSSHFRRKWELENSPQRRTFTYLQQLLFLLKRAEFRRNYIDLTRRVITKRVTSSGYSTKLQSLRKQPILKSIIVLNSHLLIIFSHFIHLLFRFLCS